MTDSTQVWRERAHQAAPARGLTITLESAVYLGLLLLALILRLAELDRVPMTDAEARQALAAWRAVWPNAAGAEIIPNSPLLYLLHSLSFSTLGGSEFTARLWTALAGAALVLLPAAFREVLGQGRALTLSLILCASPVLLIASRADSAMVWTALIGLAALWACWRWWQSGAQAFGALAMSLFVATALLTGPVGPFFVLMLLGAGVFALWLGRGDDADALDRVRDRLAGWPWISGLSAGVLATAVISTAFMLLPEGLSAVGQLLGDGLRGLTTAPVGQPPFFPVWLAVYYEPFLVIFGLGGAIWLARSGRVTFVERFFLGWLVMGFGASLVYAGAAAEHTLWLTLPLAGLAGSAAYRLTQPSDDSPWLPPAWARWMLALILVSLLFVLSTHLQIVARSLLIVPEGAFALGQVESRSAIWVLVCLLFTITGFFMAASLWGVSTAAQGWALGLLSFALVTSLGSGWNAAVARFDDPVELWHTPEAYTSEAFLLRSTLLEVAERQSGGFPKVAVTALAPQDGLVAWLLRDFTQTRFVSDIGAARGAEIVLLPMLAQPPDLGGSYVGQDFTLSRAWNSGSLRLPDLPAWWMQRRVRIPGTPQGVVVLWLRQDVYDGGPFRIQP